MKCALNVRARLPLRCALLFPFPPKPSSVQVARAWGGHSCDLSCFLHARQVPLLRMWCLGCPCPAAHSITPEVSPSFCFSGSACSQQNTTGAGAAFPGRPVSAHRKPQTLFPRVKTATSVSLLIWINLGMYIFFTGKNKMWLKRGLKHFFFPNSEVHTDSRMIRAGIYLSEPK